jgi:hypothetical protein
MKRSIFLTLVICIGATAAIWAMYNIVTSRMPKQQILPKHPPLMVKALWECHHNSVIVSAHGYYPQERPATYRLYRDANKNKVFDDTDEMIGYEVSMILSQDDYYLSQPIELAENWRDAGLFLRVICQTDTVVYEIPDCNATVSNFKEL